MVRAHGEDVEAVRPPGDSFRGRECDPRQRLPGPPPKRDLVDVVALDAKSDHDRIVEESILLDALLVVRGGKQSVVPIGEGVYDHKLAREARAIDIRPAGRHTLIAAVISSTRPRCSRISTLDIHQTEGLLVSRYHRLIGVVE
jgi:hypothetical protein